MRLSAISTEFAKPDRFIPFTSAVTARLPSDHKQESANFIQAPRGAFLSTGHAEFAVLAIQDYSDFLRRRDSTQNFDFEPVRGQISNPDPDSAAAGPYGLSRRLLQVRGRTGRNI